MDNYFDRFALKEIKENPIKLDFSKCKYLGEVHLILKEKFGLPEYYGENWDALWDCLSGLFYKRENFVAELHSFYSLSDDLQNECKKMLEVFNDVHNDTPNFTYTIIS